MSRISPTSGAAWNTITIGEIRFGSLHCSNYVSFFSANPTEHSSRSDTQVNRKVSILNSGLR